MRALIVIVGLLVLLPLDALGGGWRDKIAVVDANDRQVGAVVGSGLDQVAIALGVNGRQALLEVVSAASHVFPGGGAYPPIRGPGCCSSRVRIARARRSCISRRIDCSIGRSWRRRD